MARKPHIWPDAIVRNLFPTPERLEILNIARQKNIFRVSWRWRDDRTRKECRLLCKVGLLKKLRGPAGADYFGPIKENYSEH